MEGGDKEDGAGIDRLSDEETGSVPCGVQEVISLEEASAVMEDGLI